MTCNPAELETLQHDWKQMFQHTLPEAATSKSPAQPKWPVHVDHCFARIILDKVIGIDVPWMQKIKSPAYKNMSEQQLQDSITLGRQILDGEADLVGLDNRSLEVRRKGKGKSGKASGKVEKEVGTMNSKRKAQAEDEEGVNREIKRSKKESSNPDGKAEEKSPYFNKTEPSSVGDKSDDLKTWLKKIALSDKTTFQKKVLTALCQVPRGKYSTYGAISDHLKSSPRAVGNALRNNPFAPHVPCHRVLASGGGLGGFHGSWGKNGKEGLHDDKKRKLLREEGVKFDGRGKVVGPPWAGFF
ncbi:uncharacterized protein PAC_01760 [Phialocephala subalpina]|uniref:Methylated-DNA--protein-cysteine methyltransferase n=1 Tax=Phialocephala subalpina TaxID=576137 RepID=A0A1L7WGL5_9HELO|nr:uncharacterized protein PAC_01760 [Phialocephala subalpina]